MGPGRKVYRNYKWDFGNGFWNLCTSLLMVLTVQTPEGTLIKCTASALLLCVQFCVSFRPIHFLFELRSHFIASKMASVRRKNCRCHLEWNNFSPANIQSGLPRLVTRAHSILNYAESAAIQLLWADLITNFQKPVLRITTTSQILKLYYLPSCLIGTYPKLWLDLFSKWWRICGRKSMEEWTVTDL